MRDIPYTSKLDHAEDGRPLALDYFILVRDGEPEQYGIKVIEKNSGAQSLAFDLTTENTWGNIEMSGCFRVKVLCDLCNCGRVLFCQFDHMERNSRAGILPHDAYLRSG